MNFKYPNYPDVVERYFRRMYMEDVCLMFHSNKVCVLTLAPHHPILKKNLKVVAVDFKVTEKTDRLQNSVSGKAKRGGQFLTAKAPVCIVRCEDDSEYVIRLEICNT